MPTSTRCSARCCRATTTTEGRGRGVPLRDQRNEALIRSSMALLDQVHRRDAVARVVIGVELAQAQYRAVVLFDVDGLAGVVVDRDLRARPDRKSTRLNSSHYCASRMPSSA